MGEYNDHLHLKLEQEEEYEEALSLCDLPLDGDNKEDPYIPSVARRSSSSEPQEFFEFFTDISSEMSLAEDIIFHGKLVPFKENSPPTSLDNREDKKHIAFRRRSESLSGLQTSLTRYDSNSNKLMMRTCRSLDCRKLESLSSTRSSPDFNIERNSSVRSVGKGDVMMVKKTAKPRWFVLMFGAVKPPAEMELRDIKDRQVRLTPSTMFPSVDASKKSPVNRNSTGKATCKQLLKVLSCKDHASVAVSTSFCMPCVREEKESCHVHGA